MEAHPDFFHDAPVLPPPGMKPESGPVRRFDSGWEARAASLPATEFTGDFYATYEIEDMVWFAIGDFSGHGLGAAIFTMMVREELDRVIDHCRNDCLVEIVTSLDRTMQEEFPGNRFASLVLGRADANGRITLVNAGHCHPVIVRATGQVETVPPNGPVVGIVPFPRWGSTTVELERGDRILLYSDGLLEARNDDDDEFGLERIASEASVRPTDKTIEALLSEVTRFAAGRREDDLTLLLLSR